MVNTQRQNLVKQLKIFLKNSLGIVFTCLYMHVIQLYLQFSVLSFISKSTTFLLRSQLPHSNALSKYINAYFVIVYLIYFQTFKYDEK